MTTASLPRYIDSLSAGFPSAAEGYEDEPLNLHDWIVRHPAATFFYRVRGDQLIHEHIRDGSVLVVDRAVVPCRGRLAVVERDGAFAVIRITAIAPVCVCGVVVAIVTRL